jgi:hypothetical protein
LQSQGISQFLAIQTALSELSAGQAELPDVQKAVKNQIAGAQTAARGQISTRNAANSARAANLLRQQQAGTLLNALLQSPSMGGGQQQTEAKEPDPARIGYVYDPFGRSIFATPQQEQMFISPYGEIKPIAAAEGGSIDDLLKILKG